MVLSKSYGRVLCCISRMGNIQMLEGRVQADNYMSKKCERGDDKKMLSSTYRIKSRNGSGDLRSGQNRKSVSARTTGELQVHYDDGTAGTIQPPTTT